MDNPKAIIKLGNISHNIQQIKNIAPRSKLLAVIKADAYGHGAVRVAAHLNSNSNVSAFGVSRYSEAKKLFDANITKPILLMEGVIDYDQLIESVRRDFWLVIQNHEQFELLARLQDELPSDFQSVNIWLKFDTGMNRLGFAISDVEIDKVIKSVDNLIQSKIINPNVVIMSHFACADDIGHKLNITQLEKLNLLKEKFKNYKFQYSMANSAGVFAWPDSHNDWIRPGITLYGSSPFTSKSSYDLKLKPVMRMLSKVIAVKKIKADETVGYNATWTAPKDSIIAIIATGYGDGYPRIVSDKSVVVIQNKRCPIVGRVSMDMLAVDCSEFASDALPKIGAETELWGEQLSIDEVARACNTISYELFTQITSRVEKIYI